jgi:alkanesulfonate monooxygenase SsuD/methylene tetrahydromethanopterin reductase-like flavin-dependent oxidoreductase (luciferase family)
MRFSVTLGAVRDPRTTAELARMAEDCGWDGVFLEDYLVYQGDPTWPAYDPWICLAAMACRTETIRIGTTVTPVPRRHPWKLAAEAVALDHLSGGRVILGVGLGDRSDPFSGTPEQRAAKLDEALTLIDRFWTGEPVHHQGEHYQVDGVQLTARPVQEPRIPIWVGGDMTVEKVRRRIIRWDGSCAYKGPTDQPHPQITADDVRALRAEAGRPGFDVKVSGGYPAELAEAGATWWGRWLPPGDNAAELIRAGPPRRE